jgi:hypothetical protein
MRHYRGPYLPARPAFLLTAELPYDGLLRSPERFAGSPAGGRMDVLSEALKVVKLQEQANCTLVGSDQRYQGSVR